MTPRRRRVVFAVFAAAIVLGASGAISMESQESEAVAPIAFAYGVGVLIGAMIGGATGYLIGNALSGAEGDDDQARKAEAQGFRQGLVRALENIEFALDAYQNLWSLTSEHWVRQAELASAANWSPSASYDPDAVLSGSTEYYNAAMMTDNASRQFGVTMGSLGQRMDDWKGYDWYKDGKMRIRLSAGASSLEAWNSDSFAAMGGAAVRDAKQDKDAVFFAGGNVYASKAAKMTGADGYIINLSAGWNALSKIGEFAHPGVYYLDHGVDYCGSFVKPVNVRAAPLESGVAAVSGGKHLFVTYDGTSLSTDGSDRLPLPSGDFDEAGLMLYVVPQGSSTVPVNDINGYLEYMWKLLNKIDWVRQQTNQGALTVWNVYSEIGEASQLLTTLTVPDTYQNVEWSDDQKRLITILAMDQMADYWQKNSNKTDRIKREGYEMTEGSLTLYCRGTVQFYGAGSGSEEYLIAEDVVFTPILYRDTTLTKGTNSIRHSMFVIIWGKAGSIDSFDPSSSQDYALRTAPSGAVLNISEIEYDGRNVDSVDLDVSNVDWIDERLKPLPPIPPAPSNDLGELIRLILIILGGALVVTGLGRGSVVLAVIGLGLILAGVFLSEALEDLLEKYLGWRWEWPS